MASVFVCNHLQRFFENAFCQFIKSYIVTKMIGQQCLTTWRHRMGYFACVIKPFILVHLSSFCRCQLYSVVMLFNLLQPEVERCFTNILLI